MPEITIHLAEDLADIDDVRELCREWLDWHWRAYPEGGPPSGPEHPMEPGRFEPVLADLARIHARPIGGILLARVDGRPAGCVMWAEAEPGTAEFNRLFVRDDARGLGLGGKLLDAMFAQMASDGYQRTMFVSAKFLVHARAMYRKAGFREMAHPDGFPEAHRDFTYVMERDLTR